MEVDEATRHGRPSLSALSQVRPNVPRPAASFFFRCSALFTSALAGSPDQVEAKAGRRHKFAFALRHDGLWIFANRILPTGYLPIGAATVGGASLRGKSAAAETLSTVKNPTVLNKAINPAMLNTAR